jgi:hypothetical protein
MDLPIIMPQPQVPVINNQADIGKLIRQYYNSNSIKHSTQYSVEISKLKPIGGVIYPVLRTYLVRPLMEPVNTAFVGLCAEELKLDSDTMQDIDSARVDLIKEGLDNIKTMLDNNPDSIEYILDQNIITAKAKPTK